MAEVTSFGDAAALLNIGASFLCFGSAFGEAPNASVDLFQREVETTAGESETTEPAEPGPSRSSVGNLGSGAKVPVVRRDLWGVSGMPACASLVLAA